MENRMKIYGLMVMLILASCSLSAQNIGRYKAPSNLSRTSPIELAEYQKRVIVLLDKKGERIDGILPILSTSVELKKRYPKNRFFIGLLKADQELSRNAVAKGNHIVLFTDTEFFPGDNFIPGDQFLPGDQFFPGDQFQKQGIGSIRVLKKEESGLLLLLR